MPWYENDFITEYERKQGRKVIEEIRHGKAQHYDYVSKDLKTGEERHIEVKKRKYLKQVALSSQEFDILKADDKYYLYWVYWREDREPKVLEMPQEEILKEGNIDFQFVLSYKEEYEKYLVK